jgi:hypothetical protein
MVDTVNKYLLTDSFRLSTSIALFVAIFGAFATIYTQYCDLAIKIITIYAIYDIPYTKIDFLLHHVCVLFFVSAEYLYDIDDVHMNYLKVQMLKVEYSTIFYNTRPLVLEYFSKTELNHWIPVMSNGFLLCFVASFAKFRIYDYPVNIILREDNYNYDLYGGIVPYIHLILTEWVFYGLNLYWFQLIIFKILDTSPKPRLGKFRREDVTKS